MQLRRNATHSPLLLEPVPDTTAQMDPLDLRTGGVDGLRPAPLKSSKWERMSQPSGDVGTMERASTTRIPGQGGRAGDPGIRAVGSGSMLVASGRSH